MVRSLDRMAAAAHVGIALWSLTRRSGERGFLLSNRVLQSQPVSYRSNEYRRWLHAETLAHVASSG